MALAAVNYDYDLSTVQALMRLFTNSLTSVSLNVDQFIEMNRWVEEVIQRFQHFSKSANGALSRDEARAAFQDTLDMECARQKISLPGIFHLTDQAFDAFFKSSDPDKTRTIDTGEFIAACVTLKGLFFVFKAFNGHATGSVVMTFSQMVFAVAHVL